MHQILTNFDIILGSSAGVSKEGLGLFNTVLSKMTERSIEFEQTMQSKIIILGCAKDMSSLIQKLLEM